MPVLLNQGARTLQCLLLAFMVLFAQQAAQLHALGHAADQLAQPHKGKVPAHPIERCVAFHAVGSAVTASAALADFDPPRAACAPWHLSLAQPATCYRLPARAPPQLV